MKKSQIDIASTVDGYNLVGSIMVEFLAKSSLTNDMTEANLQ